MCLNTITKRVEKPSKKVTKAWKIFYKPSPNELYNFYYGWVDKITLGRWQTAKEVEVTTESAPRENYLSGFHCYLNKEDALRIHAKDLEKPYNVLIEVKVKEITTYGTQWTFAPCDSLVARQMLVPRAAALRKTKTMDKPTYHLKNWRIMDNILVGIIQENHQQNPRLVAGSKVYTSKILSRDGNKFETRNSFYIVEGD